MNRVVFGIVGGLVVGVGLLCPMYSFPGLGVQSFLDIGPIAIGMFVVAGFSIVHTIRENFGVLRFTGPVLLAQIVMIYFALQNSVKNALGANQNAALEQVSNIILSSVKYEWGWWVLLAGATFVLLAAFPPKFLREA